MIANKTYTKKFNSLYEISNFIKNTERNGFFKDSAYNSIERVEPKFTGTKDFATAEKMMHKGWKAGQKEVLEYIDKSELNARNERAKIYNSVIGFSPNIPNAIKGVPKNMLNFKQVKTPAKIVKVYYNICVGFEVSAQDIKQTAARLFNVLLGIEKTGVQIELNICIIGNTHDYKANYCITVPIKKAGQPFNLLNMIYPTIHAAFFRYHIFAVIERMNITENANSYGYVIDNIEHCKTILKNSGTIAENLFDYYSLRGKTEKEIRSMIK